MLDCGLRETQENKVTLPTVTQSTFNRLLAYSFGRKTEVETREDVLELLEAAGMMQIQSLVDACVQWLQANTTADNCLETFVMIRRFKPDEEERAASHVITNITVVCKSDEWCSLEVADIGFLLKMWAKHGKWHFPEIFDAVLRWIETNRADQDTSTQLLGLMGCEEINDRQDNLPDHPVLVKNPTVMKAVQECLKPKGEITLLVVGSAESKGDECTESYIYCWSENLQKWSIFPFPPEELPKDFAVTGHGNTLIVSGGRITETVYSKKIWAANWSGWKEIEGLHTARSNHGMAIIGDGLYIVGGLPSPMKFIEVRSRRHHFRRISCSVGSLPEAVYDCGVAAVKDRLIVVGGCGSKGPRNIIQTFHTVTRAAEVITILESPDLPLDLGFTRYLGTLDSPLFLSRSGHLLEVNMDGRAIKVQRQVLLKGFHHQSPFAAVLDSGGVVVCDSRSADCRYSLDGEKKEETRVVRRLRDDTQVHAVFRFFFRSEASKSK